MAAKRSTYMSLSRIRLLSADQGDRVGRLEEIIEIANSLLAEHKKKGTKRLGDTRKKTGGRDRMERGGHDREDT